MKEPRFRYLVELACRKRCTVRLYTRREERPHQLIRLRYTIHVYSILQDTYTTECKFKETVYDNYYVMYSSTTHKQTDPGRFWFIGLDEDGKPLKGSRTRKNRPSSHFIPQPIEGEVNEFILQIGTCYSNARLHKCHHRSMLSFEAAYKQLKHSLLVL